MPDAPRTADGFLIRADKRCRVWVSLSGVLIRCRVREIIDGRLVMTASDGNGFVNWEPAETWMLKKNVERAMQNG